jgi:hypothetical protein
MHKILLCAKRHDRTDLEVPLTTTSVIWLPRAWDEKVTGASHLRHCRAAKATGVALRRCRCAQYGEYRRCECGPGGGTYCVFR